MRQQSFVQQLNHEFEKLFLALDLFLGTFFYVEFAKGSQVEVRAAMVFCEAVPKLLELV